MLLVSQLLISYSADEVEDATYTLHLYVFLPIVAVIVAVPCDFPLTFPDLETVATEGLLEVQFIFSFLEDIFKLKV